MSRAAALPPSRTTLDIDCSVTVRCAVSEVQALVLFDGLPTIDGKHLVNDLAWGWPELGSPQNLVRGEHEVGFALGEAAVLLVNNHLPIDYADFEDRGVSEELWPGAINDLGRHQSHMLMSVNLENRRATDLFSIATKVTASALAAAPGALGVYWPSTPQLINRANFLEQSAVFPTLPLDLWVEVRSGKGRSGSVTASTSGLTAFGLRDLELVDAPASRHDAQLRLTNLVSQMLRHRRNITNGATLSHDDQWKVVVQVGPSKLGRPGNVSHLVFEPADNQAIIDTVVKERAIAYPPPVSREARAQSPEYQS